MPDETVLILGESKKTTPIKSEELITPNDSNPLLIGDKGKNRLLNSTSLLSNRMQFTEGLDEFEKLGNNKIPFIHGVGFSGSQLSDAQSGLSQAGASGIQFLSNFTSGLGQSVANLFDMVATGKTLQGLATGSNDNFESHLFGLSTSDMNEWAENVRKLNPIYEKNPDSLDYTDPGKWANQIAQLGTSVGMGVGTISSTIAIEAMTGGVGTAGILARIGMLGKKLMSGANAAQKVSEAFSIAKSLKGAATIYGVLNRYTESRMEGEQTYKQIYDTLGAEKKTDGTEYTEEEKKHLASEGARRGFILNELLTPLDILAFRMMVFNPISGKATGGLIEPFLKKVGGMYGKGALGKAAGFGTAKVLGAIPEGIEEQFQQWFQDEGMHYARVLSGMDDGSNFVNRFGKSFTTNDSINQGIGGFMGGLVLGPLMSGAGKIINNGRIKKQEAFYKDYLQNIPAMQSAMAEQIKAYEKVGDFESAERGRKNLVRSMALSNKHADEMNDKTTSVDNHLAFLTDTLEQAKKGNFDNLKDMGFGDIKPETQQHIIDSFEGYINDVKEINAIYDEVKDHYNRNFVPMVTQDRFDLSNAMKQAPEVSSKINTIKAGIFQYGELSGMGKEQHDIGYQLTAMIAENERLAKQFKEAKTTQEKAIVQELIDNNKAKITNLKTRLDEIGQDDTYDAGVKTKDNDILRSTLHNQEYLQAVYNKEHLDNSINYKRKKVALWNSKEFQNDLTKETIKRAKSTAAVEAIAEELKAKGEETKETKEEIAKKEKELHAQEAAAALDAKNNAANEIGDELPPMDEGDGMKKGTKADVTGNDELFARLEGITGKNGTVVASSQESDQDSNAEVLALLSPSTIDMNTMSEEDKQVIQETVKTMLEKFPVDISFEDFINSVSESYGKNRVEKLYNTLKEGWKLNDRQLTQAEANKIYNKIFSNPLDILESVTDKNEIKGEQQKIAVETEKIATELEVKENGTVVIDTNGQVVKVENSEEVVNNGNATLVLQHLLSDDANNKEFIDSTDLYHPDKNLIGTQLNVKVPENVDAVTITVYNIGIDNETMTWGEWKAQNPQFTPDTQEYQDKIPIVAYNKDAKEGDKGLAFLHDVQWYSPEQHLDSNSDTTIAKTRAIRKSVLDNTANDTSITITEKKATSFAEFKTANHGTALNPSYDFIPYTEANPEAVFVVASGVDSFHEHAQFKFNNDTDILLKSENVDYREGYVYEVRRAGWKDGKKSWYVLPVTPQPISQEVRTTVIQALTAFLNKNNPSGDAAAKAKKIADVIQQHTGLNIFRAGDLREYLNSFIRVHGDTNQAFGNIQNNKDVDAIANTMLPASSGYIVINNGGSIYIGGTKQNIIPKNQTVFINSNVFNYGSITQFFSNLTKKYITRTGKQAASVLDTFTSNYSFQAAKANKPVVMIDADGNATVSSASYKEHLLKTYNTNIRAVNVAKEGEKPVYVSNAQNISYDLSSNVSQEIKQPTIESVAEEIKTEVKTEGVTAENITPSEIEDFINQAAKDTGVDFDNITEFDELLSVATISVEERKAFNERNTRIAKLESEENAQLNAFIYNQIAIIVNREKSIKNETIKKTIARIITDILVPKQNYYKERIQVAQDIIKNFPDRDNTSLTVSIQQYQKLVNKIEEIKSETSLNKLYEKNKKDIEDNLGIKKSTLALEDELESIDREYNEQVFEDKEAWQLQSALSIDPNSKTSAFLKRFYSAIPILDTNGEPKTGVFGIPLYYRLGEVGSKVKGLLANTIADYDTMIAKLKEFKHPWIPQLLERLDKASEQTKKSFVTDMSYNSLRMGYTMLQENKRTGTWTAKNWDAMKTGIADQIHQDWVTGFDNSQLILRETNDNGDLILNKEWAVKNVIDVYDRWMGNTVEHIVSDFPYKDAVKNIKTGKPLIIVPIKGSQLEAELKTKLVSKADRLKYSPDTSKTFQIKSIGNGKYEVTKFESLGLNKTTAEGKKEISNWLSKFGINLSTGALNELLEKGLMHNYKTYTFEQLFDGSGGLFEILVKSLKYAVNTENEYSYGESGKKPVDEGVVKSLALLEYKYDTNKISSGVYIAGKSIFPITQEKFAVRRFLDLVAKDSQVRNQLKDISFSKGSIWLQLLSDEGAVGEKFRSLFQIQHLPPGLALQILGKNSQNDNSLHTLSDLDYEMMDFGLFADMKQGEVAMNYGNTSIGMRMAAMLMPTMSDKTTPLQVITAVLDLKNKDLDNGNGISQEVKQILYEQVVKPELERMLKYWQNFHANGKGTNIKDYDKGAGLFMFIPALNKIMFDDRLTLIEAIANKDINPRLNIKNIEDQIKDKIFETITSTINKAKDLKTASWEKSGVITRGEDGKVASAKWLDNTYMDKSGKFVGTIEEKVNMAILDKVVNDMIHLSNSFMMFAGDPAQYYKSKATDITAQVKESFVNVGKRLANMIAPGIKLAQSENEHYVQVFLNDRKSISDKEFMQHVTNILDGNQMSNEEYDFIQKYLGSKKNSAEDIRKFIDLQNKYRHSAGYFDIEGSDAQEYTTWQEHLHILELLGRTPDNLYQISIDDIAAARKLFNSGKTKEQLTQQEKDLIGIVMQPIKPVYTGQIYDKDQDVMRTVYIKTSSFPLIPQLTQGFEIDHLRKSLENLETHLTEKGTPMKVRASYQSGNKVGAMNNPIDLWDAEGRAKSDNLANENMLASSLVLNRKDFKIQQDVPFKSGKNKEDKQTYGTQLMKLLFGNGVMDFDGFNYQDKDWTGKDLHREYTNLHLDLVNLKQRQFFKKLGLDKQGNIVDREKTIEKIQKLLLDEASDRGFAQQVLDGLSLHKDSKEFIMPLWAAIDSNKFEALLNSIVTNNIAKIKFPGNTYVAGSPEGFKSIKTEEEVSIGQSQMVYTDSWDGDSLKATFYANGKVKKAQVFIGSKFRDNDGNIINLLDDEWSEIVNGVRKIKQDKFDKELFNITSFRIPTTGISSASQIEIVGFLPHTSADLMILPSSITKQKGLDFDIDKENTYQYWHHLTGDGRFEKLSDKHKDEILGKAETLRINKSRLNKLYKEYQEATTEASKKYVLNKIESERNSQKLGTAILDGEITYKEEANDIEDARLESLADKLEEKFIQNKIIEIYEAVLSNPDAKLQAKINSVLNTDYAEGEANFIESLTSSKEDNWTPLTSEYQKSKVALGASGKMGTGAYSMDVVFHSLAQQAAALGTPLQLLGEDGELKEWRFGITEEGGIKSTGVLGSINTLDRGRTTADLLNEMAQTAVDNEKLQIMGRVNINGVTLDVHKVFNLLGIDKFKTDSEHSVAYLFLSQPILKEYVALLNNSKSILSEYQKNKKETIIEELMLKYGGAENDSIEEDSDLLGEEQLIDGIKNSKPDGNIQRAAFRRFLEMEKYGLALRNIQTTINVDSKGLDKSFYDVIQKRTRLDKLGQKEGMKVEDIGMVTNVSNLVGTYVETPRDNQQLKQDYLNKGYFEMGKYMVLPNTYVGALNVATVATAYNTWHNILPYDSPIFGAFYEELKDIIENENQDSDSKTVENKQDILAEFKKYVATMRNSGFIGENDNVNDERARLYLDTYKFERKDDVIVRFNKAVEVEHKNTKAIGFSVSFNDKSYRFFYGPNNTVPDLIKVDGGELRREGNKYIFFEETIDNMSLPTYLFNLLKEKGNPIIEKFVKTNKLINSLEIVPNKNGQASLMKLKNSGTESWNEEQLYEALDTLMEVRGKNGVLTLPKIGNKEYTLDSLAQDIINYSMLGNAKQEAIQYSKYISVNYLDMVGYAYTMRNLHKKLNGTNNSDNLVAALKINSRTANTMHHISEFSIQYVQHHPEAVKYSVTEKEAKTELIKEGENRYIFAREDRPTFIKVYDKNIKSKKKFRLFKLIDTHYSEIPVLGTFGMDEYQFGRKNGIGQSIVNGEMKKAREVAPTIKATNLDSNNLYSIATSDSVKTVVEGIANDKTNPFHQLAVKMLEIGISNKLVLSETIKTNGGKPYTNFNGSWDPSTRIITINPRVTRNKELLAQTILHELVHEATFDKINPWIKINADGSIMPLDNAPAYVTNLAMLFNHSRGTVKKEEIDNFITNMDNVTDEDKSRYYGFTNVHEFMTMALTDRGFQKILNKIEYKQSGKTLLDKFKELVHQILESLGITFDENFTAAHAISAIFEVIQADNTKEDFNPYDTFYSEDNDPQLSISTSNFPKKRFNISNTECA